jgi:hypothetical protein
LPSEFCGEERVSGILFARGQVGFLDGRGVRLGSQRVAFPEDATALAAAAGSRVVLRGADWSVLDLETGTTRTEPFTRLSGDSLLEVALDPTGRWLVAVTLAPSGVPGVALVDLETPRPAILVPALGPLESPHEVGAPIEVSFSPGARRAHVKQSFVERTPTPQGSFPITLRSAMVDLVAGTAALEPTPSGVHAWSADGAATVRWHHGSYGVHDGERVTLFRTRWAPLAVLDPRRVLVAAPRGSEIVTLDAEPLK